MESKGSDDLPGTIEKESALTKGSGCLSSAFSRGLETGLAKVDDVDDLHGELCTVYVVYSGCIDPGALVLGGGVAVAGVADGGYVVN